MPTTSPVPTIEDVERIASVADPVLRNRQITQCYYELSVAVAGHTGPVANWCTFATWASRQAGQTIRKEDLAKLVENRLKRSPQARSAASQVNGMARPEAGVATVGAQDVLLAARSLGSALDRAADAVARGNKKVFEEVGYEFARFYHTCLQAPLPGEEAVTRFCDELRPGLPPEGQVYLRRAFQHYAQALHEENAKARAELILLANIEIGFHEQTRLQPEIAESLDAGLVSSVEFTRLVLEQLFPFSSWFTLLHLMTRRLLGRPTRLDLAIQSLLSLTRHHLRQTITEVMMTIALPSGTLLRLGDDLSDAFPASLQQLTNPELQQLLQQIDPTPDSPLDSGARDWANLPDRLHFIVDFFRCYQERVELLEAPFGEGEEGRRQRW